MTNTLTPERRGVPGLVETVPLSGVTGPGVTKPVNGYLLMMIFGLVFHRDANSVPTPLSAIVVEGLLFTVVFGGIRGVLAAKIDTESTRNS